MKTAISVEWSKQKTAVYYYAIAIKCLAIAMPHAFLTLVFLKKNFNVSEIAVIQAFYSIAVVLFEFPSGVLADKFNRKKIFLISNILLMVSYAIVFVSDQILLIIIAWGLYGTAAAFETGTIDAEIIMMIKKCFTGELQKKKIEEFVGRENRISSISAIIGAILGFFLYRLIEINIYMLMGLLVFLSFLLVAFKYRSLNIGDGQEDKKLLDLIRTSIKEIQNSRKLKLIIVGFGFLQMFIQLHFQLWQSFFLELGIKDTWFLIIYFLFQGIVVLAYRLWTIKILEQKAAVYAILTLICSAGMLLIDNKAVVFSLYCISVLITFCINYYLDVTYNMYIKEENISSLISLKSTIMRCFGAGSLIFSSIAAHFISLKIIIPIFAAICLCATLIIINMIKKTHHSVQQCSKKIF